MGWGPTVGVRPRGQAVRRVRLEDADCLESFVIIAVMAQSH